MCAFDNLVGAGTHRRLAFLLSACVAVLLELTELTKPVEMPCLRCNTEPRFHWLLALYTCRQAENGKPAAST